MVVVVSCLFSRSRSSLILRWFFVKFLFVMFYDVLY